MIHVIIIIDFFLNKHGYALKKNTGIRIIKDIFNSVIKYRGRCIEMQFCKYL